MTTMAEDLVTIARQEQVLVFDRFDEETAWRIGSLLRVWALEQGAAIVIDVRLFHRELFFAALPGSTADNVDWVRRKTNVVRRFQRSSYRMGLEQAHKGTTLAERYGLPLSDYAAHGGAFPISVAGAGVIGAVTVSGLPQREDHNLVVRALAGALGIPASDVAL